MRFRNRVESPCPFPGGCPVGLDETSNPIFSTIDSYDYLVFDREGRKCETVSFAIICCLSISDDITGFCVESHHMRIEGSHKNLVPQGREASVYQTTTGSNFRRQRTLIPPDRSARSGIQRDAEVI